MIENSGHKPSIEITKFSLSDNQREPLQPLPKETKSKEIVSEAKERTREHTEGETEDRIYREYMEFKPPEKNLWTKETLKKEFRKMGVTEVNLTEKDENIVDDCYGGEYRSFHGRDHANIVASAGDVIAGAGHDFSYKHVDASPDGSDAWSESVAELLEDVATYKVTTDEDGKQIFTTYLTDAGKKDPMTQMVAGIFGVGEEGIGHKEGGNEFDSALATVKLMQRVDKKQQLDPREFIVKTAKIAGTYPFQQSVEKDENGTIVGDGHMGELAHKIKDAKLTYGGKTGQLTWDETNKLMRDAVKMANCDIVNFTNPDGPADLIDGGRKVKKEEVKALREVVTNMEELVQVGELQSATLLYSWVSNDSGPVSADKVADIYFDRDENGKIIPGKESYPPRWVWEKATAYVKENCEAGDDASNAHRAAIDFVASIATKIDEPNPKIPGFVHEKTSNDQLTLHGNKAESINPIVEKVLNEGMGQTDIQDHSLPRVPRIGGFLYRVLGPDGIRELAGHLNQIREKYQGVKNPFATEKVANTYFEKVQDAIGEENVRTIVTELYKMANDPELGNKNRAEKLKALIGGKLAD